MNSQELISEILEKYGEHFERVGDEESPRLMISILSQMVLKEREKTSFYKEVYNSKAYMRIN